TCCPQNTMPFDLEVTYDAAIVTAGHRVESGGQLFDNCTHSFPKGTNNKITVTCTQAIPNGAIVAISTTPSKSDFKSAFWSDKNGKNIGDATPTRNVVVISPEPGSIALLGYGLVTMSWLLGRLRRRS